jgi:hypothetical protein
MGSNDKSQDEYFFSLDLDDAVPVWDKGERSDGSFSRSGFIFDEQSDSYSCQNGKQLLRFQRNFKAPRTGVTKSNEVQYRASQMDCATCPLNERCCFNAKLRKVMRSVDESARDVARAVRKTEAYRRTRRHSKSVEMLFAHMKRILRMDRLRLRGFERRTV